MFTRPNQAFNNEATTTVPRCINTLNVTSIKTPARRLDPGFLTFFFHVIASAFKMLRREHEPGKHWHFQPHYEIHQLLSNPLRHRDAEWINKNIPGMLCPPPPHPTRPVAAQTKPEEGGGGGRTVWDEPEVHRCFSHQMFITGCCCGLDVIHCLCVELVIPVCWRPDCVMHSLLARKHLGCSSVSINSWSEWEWS